MIFFKHHEDKITINDNVIDFSIFLKLEPDYEMGNYEDAVKILNQIIKTSKITSIKTKADDLLAMIKK